MKQFVNFIRNVVAFPFSVVGISILLLGLAVIGACILVGLVSFGAFFAAIYANARIIQAIKGKDWDEAVKELKAKL